MIFLKTKVEKVGISAKCKLCAKIISNKHYKHNLQQYQNTRKLYRKTQSYKDCRKKSERKAYKNNIQFKLRKILRSRIKSSVRNLGCSMQEFKTYIESKWQEGMTWDNYGCFGWHIDHIQELHTFDLTDNEQLLRACHYTNLQPLWCQDNYLKHKEIKNGKK